MNLLKFSPANAKLKKLYNVKKLQKYLKGGRKIYSLDLLSGHTCPGAKECLSKVVVTEDGRRIKDGVETKFRCFSASQEALLGVVYNLRQHNLNLLKQCKTYAEMQQLIEQSFPKNAGIVRLHVAGDFFNQSYMFAWIQVAKNHPKTLFYGYTKSLPYWIKFRSIIPNNFVLTASYGGRYDNLIDMYGFRNAKVVFHPDEAKKLKLDIDHDDSHAALHGKSFALLIHGTMPKGSDSSKAIQLLRKSGIKYSYTR